MISKEYEFIKFKKIEIIFVEVVLFTWSFKFVTTFQGLAKSKYIFILKITTHIKSIKATIS